jgi:hypothetical protein
LSEGYLRAAKNKFQAHRILRVGKEDLIFHVDFLNEHNPGEELNLVGGRGLLQSIYTPAMEAVFKYDEYRSHPKLTGVRFPSVPTFIASKAMAARVKKRSRDAFDILVSIADQEPASFQSKWRGLVSYDGLFRDANDALWSAVHEENALMKIRNVFNELSCPSPPSNDEILSAFEFLDRPLLTFPA